MNNPRSFVSALRRAWRSFIRRPGFFVIAVSSLAVALGLATTIIAQIDSLLHPYTPVRDADRVFVATSLGAGTGNRRPMQAEVRSMLQETGLFAGVATISSIYAPVEVGRGLVQTNISFVGSDFFALLGLRPRLGRLFTSQETSESGVAIVGNAYWKRYFNNASQIGDASIVHAGRTYKIVGVGDAGWEQSFGTGFWIPTAPATAIQRYMNGQFIVRLDRGVSEKRATAALEQVAARWTSIYGVARSKFRFWLRTVRPDPLQIGDFQIALIGAAIFILVIASANVSALMLARSVGRRRDQALQLALGAGRRDLLRDVVAEISILAFAGSVLGLVFAFAAMSLMVALTPVEVSWLGFARPNLSIRVFGGLLLAALTCITLSTLVPASYITRIAPAEPLKESSGTTTGRAYTRFRLIVVGEMALAMILLFGASLIFKTAHLVTVFDFGYDARPVGRVWSNTFAVESLSPRPKDTLDAIARWRFTPEILNSELTSIVDRIRSTPGVRSAAWYTEDAAERFIIADIKGTVDTGAYNPVVYNVGPSFLATLGLPLLRGRDFVDGDRHGNGAAILDERTAFALFGTLDPVGRMVKLGPPASKLPWMPVVGVVRNALHELPIYPEMDPPLVVYVTRPRANRTLNFVYRLEHTSAERDAEVVRRVRDALPPRASTEGVKWVSNYTEALAGRRFTAGIFSALSLASLALATAGLFGVLSYAVSQRMREFAIRVALGARRRSIIELVVRDGAVMALGGTAIGAFAGMYAAFVVYDWLWGVYPVDALSLVIAEAILFAVTAAAAALPALRATRANPAEVIRAL